MNYNPEIQRKTGAHQTADAYPGGAQNTDSMTGDADNLAHHGADIKLTSKDRIPWDFSNLRNLRVFKKVGFFR
jgi:hypothetical protein